jgi:ABC-type antimicrobial peptide transport system permease subunit
MSLFRYIFRSLLYFRRQHLALFAGTLVATAVLTGALIIGDSVRFSLQKMAENRLGGIRYSLSTGGRFVRSALAAELSVKLDAPASAVLILQGIAINQENQSRINRTQVVGIDSSFWDLSSVIMPAPGSDGAVLSENAAKQLGLKVGDALLLRVEKASLIPLNAPFSPENRPSVAFRLTICGIADDYSLGRFSLKSNQVAPFTVFMNRDALSEKLELAGLSNFILLGENKNHDLSSEKISNIFAGIWKPIDAGLLLKDLPEPGNYELVSNRVFIDLPVSNEIEKMDVQHDNMMSYLVNSIHTKADSTPYSFVTASPSSMLPADTKEGDIVINDWLANDLGIKQGDSVSLDYFVIGPLRKLNEKGRKFRVSAVIPTRGSFTDSTMMPDFPGLSEAGSCRDWNTGVPIDLKRIRDKDELYWDVYKGTPKALISLKDGLSMWTNSFGQYTSIRFHQNNINQDTLLNRLMHRISPEQLGMRVTSVYSEGLASAGNAVDFGQLFLGLSFFIIASGLLLIFLIFSLNAASRSTETALLSGLGLSSRLILRIRIAESFVVVLLGSIFGALAGIFYNFMLVKALNTIWQGAVQTNMLGIHIRFWSLFLGAGIGFILAFATIILVSRRNLKEQITELLKGNQQYSPPETKRFLRRNYFISIIALLCAALLTLYSLFSGAYEDPALFLTAGALFLIGSIYGISWALDKFRESNNDSRLSIFILALKNASRKKARSLTVVLLLAIGVYSIILTGAYRKTFSGAENQKSSGTGGYLFWAETSLPIPADLNTPEVQNKYLTGPLSPQIHFEQFHSLEGDDASCLNLNQVNRPRILGAHPENFANRKAFSLTTLLNKKAKEQPWLELQKDFGKDVIPAFADQSVIQYGLKRSLGDTLIYLNEAGERIKILLAGGLDNSVFQGSLLIDDSHFRKHFPSSGGSSVMLIDAPLSEESALMETMNRSFSDYGIELTKATVRLATFNTVENTYLTVFMILGGLGLIIGTFGLAIVLFRNILERRKEFALLSAIGFRDKQIVHLILTENLFLLLSGMGCGILSAFISILPSFLSPVFHTQILPVLVILILVLLSGLLWIWIPARSAIRGNTAEVLRNE